MSGSSEVLHATIRATDESSETLRDILARVKELELGTKDLVKESREAMLATKELSAVSKEMAFTSGAAFKDLRGHIAGTRAALGHLHGAFASFFPMFASWGAAGSVLGLFDLTKNASANFMKGQADREALGLSSPMVKALSLGAKEHGIAFKPVIKGIAEFREKIAGAKSGKDKNALAFFGAAHLD